MDRVLTVGNYCGISRPLDSCWAPQCTFNMAGPCSQYPLHEAAEQCDIESMRRILREGRVSVNSKDEKGCTALYYVISREWRAKGVEAVGSLCEYGSDVNERLEIMDPTKPSYLFTAMCEYSQGNFLISIMKALLSAGKILFHTFKYFIT